MTAGSSGWGSCCISAAPQAVAEAAATLDELSSGRLQFGVGSGPFPGAWEALGKKVEERHQLYDVGVTGLHRLFSGDPVNSLSEVQHPPARGLRRRVWQATSRGDLRLLR